LTLNLADVRFKVWREGWRWKNQYYDYSEMVEIDLILEEYFNAA
jgi:hypothetical protein